MKKLVVGDKCSGCGLCIINCSYLRENAQGNAEPVTGKGIAETDLELVQKVVEDCPEKALQIIETGTTSKKGKEGIREVIDALKRDCEAFSVRKINTSDIHFDGKKYDIPIPYGSGEYRYDYSSESAARSAATSQFMDLCYSERAYRPMIKKVFVEYKVQVLRPYYLSEDKPESAYYTYNQQVRKKLADAYAEINTLQAGENRVPDSWMNFCVYLDEQKSGSIYTLKNYDNTSTSSGIMSAMKSISHTDLSDYVDEMDFEDREDYVGEGLFGAKYKTRWCFSHFQNAVRSFMDDLKWAIEYQSDEIEEWALGFVNTAMSEFEEAVKKEWKKKIEELEEYTK